MRQSSTPPGSQPAFDRATVKDAISNAVAAERAGQAHGAVGKILKNTIIDLRRQTLRHETRGGRIAAQLSAGTDVIIEALFAAAPAEATDEMAIAAVGGFGRAELAPYSDVDLLFLYRPAFEEHLHEALNLFLYPLWDSGLKLGYAAHTPKSAAAFAKEDMVARTAYLDARFLCGARVVFDEFQTAYDKLRRKTKTQFVAAKLEEQSERQSKAFETRYLVEPDVKEGKGGLRDLQTIRWLYKYVYGGAIGENRTIDKIMESSERRALAKAERFLWSVRAHMHDFRGRADEKLTFDLQPEIAARLGYADRPDMTAAERLMKHYFVNTVEVGRLTRILCARLEEERAKRLPQLPALLPRALQQDEAPGKPNLRIHNGRLDFNSAARARRQPRDLFRLFRAFSKQPKFDFHPDALAIVAEQVPNVISDARKDPDTAKLFNAILTEAGDPVRVLRIMTETGLLGKYIPAFGSIVGRIDYGLYRRFTLDEHVLRCIGLLSRIRRGEFKKDHPIATGIVRKAEDPLVFYLALLLHEAIWTLKEKSVDACERLVVRVSKRLGLSPQDAALAGWAAARHLMMVRTAERRDLAEAYAIATFAERVETCERLDLMLVLSVCHLRIVGLQSWDEITRRRLTELYESAKVYLQHGETALAASLQDRSAAAREEITARLAGWNEKDKEAFLSRLTDVMLRSVEPDILVRYAYLAQAAKNDNADAAVAVTPRDGDLEAIVCAYDRQGLLADLAGGVASAGMSVRSVQALTTSDGKAIDIFAIQSPDGFPIDDVEQARSVHRLLLASAEAPPKKTPALKRRFGDRRSIFSVAPAVRIELSASEEATVIETEGLDRPGLLYELTSALSGLGVTIASAHIATYGERAVDAFYLTTKTGEKITNAKTLSRIEKSLLKVLSAGSGA